MFLKRSCMVGQNILGLSEARDHSQTAQTVVESGFGMIRGRFSGKAKQHPDKEFSRQLSVQSPIRYRCGRTTKENKKDWTFVNGLVGSMPLQLLEIGFHVEIHAIEWHDFQRETQIHGVVVA